jgi:general secretion pathway protein I
MNFLNINHNQKGFTLLEVMMALLIFGIMALTFQKSTSQTIDQYYRIKMHSFADWIAENKMTQLRLAGVLPMAREYKEEVVFANMKWQIKSQVSKTQDPDLVRVDIKVYSKPDDGSKPLQAGVFSGVVGKY